MTLSPRLLAIATAVPPHGFQQEEVRERIPVVFPECREEVERLLPVFLNAGIETRYSCVPLDWYERDHGWTDRNELYIEHSAALLEVAARRCVDRAGLSPGDVDGLVVASTTGVATPSLDALLMERMDFRRDILRLPIFGLGCCGGVIGLARTARLARATPDEKLLFLVVEPCALTFRRNDRSKSNIVATALFGDGAAAALIGCEGEGPAIVASGEHTWPDTLDVTGWGVEADGLRVVFSRDIPALIRERFRPALDAFLDRHGLALGDIDQWLCHPGGAKVLDALEDVLERRRGSLEHSRAVLRDYGNMSAVTVMFVLAHALDDGGIGRRALMSALGPGFTAGFLMMENGATEGARA
jgi:alkylresorcinol/alkylpyrone synthase